jgi:hypothetical protein
MSWGVYPNLPKAGSYGYDVSKENMFDYDKRELANVLVHFLWLGCLYFLTLSLIVPSLSAMVEKSLDDLDLVVCNTCRAALKKGLVSEHGSSHAINLPSFTILI